MRANLNCASVIFIKSNRYGTMVYIICYTTFLYSTIIIFLHNYLLVFYMFWVAKYICYIYLYIHLLYIFIFTTTFTNTFANTVANTFTNTIANTFTNTLTMARALLSRQPRKVFVLKGVRKSVRKGGRVEVIMVQFILYLVYIKYIKIIYYYKYIQYIQNIQIYKIFYQGPSVGSGNNSQTFFNPHYRGQTVKTKKT